MARPLLLASQTPFPSVVHPVPSPISVMYLTPKSGIFLLGSCVAAIAAVGSVFEISSGTPDLGMQTTSIILGLSIPMTVVLFFAAVRDARANQ